MSRTISEGANAHPTYIITKGDHGTCNPNTQQPPTQTCAITPVQCIRQLNSTPTPAIIEPNCDDPVLKSRYNLRPRPCPSPYNRWQGGTQTRYVAALIHLIHQEEQANVVIYPTSGQELEYRQLIRGPNGDTWIRAISKDLVRLAQGVSTRMPTGTNTIFFIAKSAISHGHKVTFARMIASIRSTKSEVNRVRVTVGGNRLDFPGATTTHCTGLTTIKCLLNSTISTPGARFMTLDIKDFYYGTAMARYEYMKLSLACIPEKSLNSTASARSVPTAGST